MSVIYNTNLDVRQTIPSNFLHRARTTPNPIPCFNNDKNVNKAIDLSQPYCLINICPVLINKNNNKDALNIVGFLYMPKIYFYLYYPQ